MTYNIPSTNSLNIKNAPYFAAGDGIKDDTTIIQSAINDAITSGATLFLPPGNYKITASLVVNNVFDFIMSGSPSTAFIWEGNATDPALLLESCYKCRFENFSVECSTPYTLAIGIKIITSNAGGAHISTRNQFSNLSISGNTNEVIKCVVIGGGLNSNNDFHSFDNCSFSNYDSIGIQILDSQCYQNIITNCLFESFGIQTATGSINIGVNPNILSTTTNIFKASDVGKLVEITNALDGTNPLRTTISAYNAANNVTLTNAAGATVSGVTVYYGPQHAVRADAGTFTFIGGGAAGHVWSDFFTSNISSGDVTIRDSNCEDSRSLMQTTGISNDAQKGCIIEGVRFSGNSTVATVPAIQWNFGGQLLINNSQIGDYGSSLPISIQYISPFVTNTLPSMFMMINTILASNTSNLSTIFPYIQPRMINCKVNGASIFPLPEYDGIVNVKEYGAFGNGNGDDAATIQAALSATTGVCYLPAGTYKINSTINFNSPSLVFKGAGIDVTTITANGTSMTMFDNTADCKNLTIEDITFDYNTHGLFCFLLNGFYFESLIFKRCKFTGSGTCNMNFFYNGGNNITYQDCIFDAQGQCNANGIILIGSMSEILVSNCSFRGLLDGISVQPGTNNLAISKVIIEKSYFDFMYYTAPALDGYANSGGTVSYTSSTLTDTSKIFIISSYGTIKGVNYLGIIRASTSVRTGTITQGNKTQLIDSSGTFLSSGLVKGDIIRTSTAYAIVKNIDSNTTINIEGWLDSTTAAPITYATGSYTAYKVTVAKIGSMPGNVGHTITIYNGWLDLFGNLAPTPANGTLYEIVPQPNYPISCQSDVEQVKIINNVFLRSYTDQISPFGNNSEIAGNIIEDGQDMGITIDGSADGYNGRHIVHDNLIMRHGTSGIFVGGNQCIIHDNQIYGWGTRQYGLDAGTGAIAISPSTLSLLTGGSVHNNIMDGYGYPLAGYGISISGVQGIHILDNQISNVQIHDIQLSDSSTQNNIIRHATDSIEYNSSGGLPPGQLLDVYGTQSPLGALAALPSSLYKDTSGGLVWIKTANTNTSGWQLITTNEFTPGTISNGLQFWVRADKGLTLSGSNVTSWADQSGSGDSNKNLTAIASHYPTISMSDSDFNNQPCLVFNPAILPQYLVSGTWASPSPQPSTWMWVVKTRVSGLMVVANGLSSTANQYLFQNSSSFISIGGHLVEFHSPDPTNLDGQTTIVIGVFNGSSSKLYTNHITPTMGNADVDSQLGMTVGIYSDTSNFPLDGKIAEIASWNRALSNDEVIKINRYASARYNVLLGT